MKTLHILRIPMIVLSGFLFIQCTSDLEIPDSIAGAPGVDGINGIDGTDGFDGTASCVTCHGRHSTFDFENDGFDYALLNIDAVTLVIDESTVIDFGDVSNNYITCHQPRNS